MEERTEVELGHSTQFKCQYERVSNVSLLVVKWHFEKYTVPTKPLKLYTYDGIKNKQAFHTNSTRFYIKQTDLRRESTIVLENATLEDEGQYTCKVEYLEGGFHENLHSTFLTVTGNSNTTLII